MDISTKREQSIFFPGINGLRFVAALAVIITHVELLKEVYGFPNCWKNPFIFNLGGLGVYFFFVLSGFLITYLLLKEKDKFGKISIREFYIRRILRIWPLYYFIAILGFFVLPQIHAIDIAYLEHDFKTNFYTNLLLYIFILPNLAFSMFRAVPHIGQAWSIGVEEQFYIAWPWIISKAKNTLRSLVVIVVVLFLIKAAILFCGFYFANESWYQTLKNFVAMSKFECMAIGGIGAYFLHTQNKKVLSFTYHPLVLIASVILIPVLTFVPPGVFQDGIHIIYSAAFLVIIINVATNPRIWIKLENRQLSYLGKISYGIYMYHFLLIPFVLLFLGTLKTTLNLFWFNVLAYAGSLVLTILVSALSYRFLESYFIKLKSKFSPVRSTNEAGEVNAEPTKS